MTRYLTEDRRRKPEGEYLEYLVKPRFTEAEFSALEKAAAMTTEGRMAPLVRMLALEGLAARQDRQARLMAKLADGESLTDGDRRELADLLARTAEQRLMETVAHRELA
ncbi:MAG: hypothetical protein ACQEUM_07130 [Pseudomonadota bacterium]